MDISASNKLSKQLSFGETEKEENTEVHCSDLTFSMNNSDCSFTLKS